MVQNIWLVGLILRKYMVIMVEILLKFIMLNLYTI